MVKMSGPGTPPPAPTVDPVAIIAQDQAAKLASAQSQARLNATYQSSPFGSTTPTFNKNGTISYNTAFSPTEQPLYNASVSNRGAIGSALPGVISNVYN